VGETRNDHVYLDRGGGGLGSSLDFGLIPSCREEHGPPAAIASRCKIEPGTDESSAPMTMPARKKDGDQAVASLAGPAANQAIFVTRLDQCVLQTHCEPD
jgi:hypothetical protein